MHPRFHSQLPEKCTKPLVVYLTRKFICTRPPRRTTSHPTPAPGRTQSRGDTLRRCVPDDLRVAVEVASDPHHVFHGGAVGEPLPAVPAFEDTLAKPVR